MRIDPASLDQLLHPTIDPHAARDIIASGLPASPGAATGEIVFTSEEAVEGREGGPQGHPGAGGNQSRRTFTACTPPKAFSPRAAA
jgi:phosphoenolpyruvate synthase/pyruvate phosphate dikinase